MSTSDAKPVVLTIAGLDPSGGAGIVADIKTIAALGCFPAAALTSVTFQNTTGVFGAEHQTAATLRAQVEPIVHDLDVAAAKTGMLPTAEIVAEVARLFATEKLPAPVVDPVVVATSGDVLIDEEAFEILKRELFPLARVVTPNIPEAEKLTGLLIQSDAELARAVERLHQLALFNNEAISSALTISSHSSAVTIKSSQFRKSLISAANVAKRIGQYQR